MKPQTRLCAARVAWLSSLPPDSAGVSLRKSIGSSSRPTLQRLVALAMALILLPLTQVEVFAQQAPGWPQQYGQYPQNQYAPGPQPAYGQPGYAQPQTYPQQPYAQQSSPEQPYAQQPYPEQAYPPQPSSDQTYADTGQGYSQPGYGQAPPAAQPFTAEQLEQMLAPIALYPDTLLAEALTAATYPAQVAVANQWLQAQGYASPDQIVAGADAQNWDPSIKSLTAFPQVLAQMDHDLGWTTDLGNAYFNQPQDVLQTVQVLRQRAQATGTLQNTPQEQMTYDQGNIELAPANPQVVYVPAYNPWNVYGAPVAPYPGFSLLGTLGSIFGSSPIQYGLGIAMAAFMHTPFGWMSWALDWLGNSVLFNHSHYYSRSTTVAHWGSPRGTGPVAATWAARNRQAEGYNRAASNQYRGAYGRPANAYNSYNGTNRQGAVRPQDNDAGNRAYAANGYAQGRSYVQDRGYGYAQRPAGNPVRPAMENYAYNRPQASMPVRPQQTYAPRTYTSQSYARPGYGSSYLGGQAYGRTSNTYASPQRGELSQRAYAEPRETPMSRGFEGYSAKSEHSSGGFHLFGGGHNSEKSYGSYKAPKVSSPKHSSGGHSSGGHGGGHHH